MVVLYDNKLDIDCLTVKSKEEYIKIMKTQQIDYVILNHFICNSNKREMIENNILLTLELTEIAYNKAK